MASITLENSDTYFRRITKVGSQLADFKMIQNDLSVASLSNFAGKKLILNIFPSIDTGTCAASVRKFNEVPEIWKIPQYYVFQDLPFAQKRFCGAEGLENVVNLSDFQEGDFGKKKWSKSLTVPSRLTFQVLIVADASGTITYETGYRNYR
jgi:thiol peroxidase